MKTIPPDHYVNTYCLETQFSGTSVMDKLWEYISNAKENPEPHKARLAGNIFSSLILIDPDNWFFDNVCLPTIRDYKEHFGKSSAYWSQSVFKNNVHYVLNSFWVNFQKQHEFNPVHHHTGLWSFNIFMKIPYDWKEQYELPHIKASNSPAAGNFEFLYTDISGDINGYVYRLDPTCEGLMLFFPAEMRHLVYPFYDCEEERITISGNIVYDI